MKIFIYRYSNPSVLGNWIYTGQTKNLSRRDKRHRAGVVGFGARFKKQFPDSVLPVPDFYEVEVSDHLDANWEETVAIFSNHTWHGQGGMNLTIPGSGGYLEASRMGGLVTASRQHMTKQFESVLMSPKMVKVWRTNGLRLGKLSVETKLGIFKDGFDKTKGPRAAGRIAVESGQITDSSMHTYEITSKGGRVAGKKNAESGWAAELGRRAVESGLLIRMRKKARDYFLANPEKFKEVCKLGNLAGIKWGLENPEKKRVNSQKAMHVRWHVKRNMFRENCKFCLEDKKGDGIR